LDILAPCAELFLATTPVRQTQRKLLQCPPFVNGGITKTQKRQKYLLYKAENLRIDELDCGLDFFDPTDGRYDPAPESRLI
jgi:hypothetical protein